MLSLGVTTLAILAYNEEKKIKKVIDTFIDSFDKLIVIDDASKDNTSEILKTYSDEKITILSNSKNLGAGKSLEICINYFLKTGDNYLVKIDGDGQFKNNDILKIKKYIETSSFDFIKCDRFWEKGIEGDIPTIRYFGNAFASFLAKFSTGNWRVNDPLNGLFGFSKTSLENFRLPKLFYRYGYPFFLVTYMLNQSSRKKIKVGQLKNTIFYNEKKKSINPFIMFFKLFWYSFKNYYSKINWKLKYSKLQGSALLDIVSQLFIILSLFALFRFFSIRYFSYIGPQGIWFLVFIIFFSFSAISLYLALNIENEIAQENFEELN